MTRLLCYLRHRPFHVVVRSSGFPWPVAYFLDAAYDWHCVECDKGGAKGREYVRGFTFAGGLA